MVSGGDVNGLVVGRFTFGAKGEISDSRDESVRKLVETELVDERYCARVTGLIEKDQIYFGAICWVKPSMKQTATPAKIRALLVASEDDDHTERKLQCKKGNSATICHQDALTEALIDLRRRSDQDGPLQAVSIVTEGQRSGGETQRDVKFFAK